MNRPWRRDRHTTITTRTADRAAVPMLLMALIGSVAAAGCASAPRENAAAEPAPRATANARNAASPEAVIQEVEQRYVVGPIAARELGYQVDWQFREAGRNLKAIHIGEESIFTLDERNFLTRIERDTGRRIWRVPAAEPIQEISGINAIGDTVYLTAGGRLLLLDGDTGSQIGLQRLEKIANTPPVHSGQFLIYGGRNGQLIWHSYAVAYQWRAYQISPSINITPLHVQDDPWEPGYIVTVGNDGRVTVHDAGTASMLWDKRLLSSVVARPVAGRGAVFVAGMDQHLWAYDLYSGRSLWRHLTDTPLTDSPVIIGDRVYQQIDTEGLVCFEATPLDSPGGRIQWTAEGVRGNVIARRGNRLYVWNRPDQELTVLDATRGGVIQQRRLRQTSRLVSADLEGSELYAISNDGRVVRLLARN